MEQDQSPVDHLLPPVVQNQLPVEQDIPPVEQDLPRMKQDLPLVEQDLPRAEQDLPPVEQELPPVEHHLPPVEQDLPRMEQDLLPVEQDIPSVEQDLPRVEQDLLPVEQDQPRDADEGYDTGVTEPLTSSFSMPTAENIKCFISSQVIQPSLDFSQRSRDADDSIMDSQLLDSTVEPAVSPPASQIDKNTTEQLTKYQYYQDSMLPIAPTHLIGEGEGSPTMKSKFPSSDAIKEYLEVQVLQPSIELANTYKYYSDDEFSECAETLSGFSSPCSSPDTPAPPMTPSPTRHKKLMPSTPSISDTTISLVADHSRSPSPASMWNLPLTTETESESSPSPALKMSFRTPSPFGVGSAVSPSPLPAILSLLDSTQSPDQHLENRSPSITGEEDSGQIKPQRATSSNKLRKYVRTQSLLPSMIIPQYMRPKHDIEAKQLDLPEISALTSPIAPSSPGRNEGLPEHSDSDEMSIPRLAITPPSEYSDFNSASNGCTPSPVQLEDPTSPKNMPVSPYNNLQSGGVSPAPHFCEPLPKLPFSPSLLNEYCSDGETYFGMASTILPPISRGPAYSPLPCQYSARPLSQGSLMVSSQGSPYKHKPRMAQFTPDMSIDDVAECEEYLAISPSMQISPSARSPAPYCQFSPSRVEIEDKASKACSNDAVDCDSIARSPSPYCQFSPSPVVLGDKASKAGSHDTMDCNSRYTQVAGSPCQRTPTPRQRSPALCTPPPVNRTPTPPRRRRTSPAVRTPSPVYRTPSPAVRTPTPNSKDRRSVTSPVPFPATSYDTDYIYCKKMDASTLMNFDCMVQFEGQAEGASYTSVEQYVYLAMDLAVRDTFKQHVQQGSLHKHKQIQGHYKIGLAYDHPSDQRMMSSGYGDSACQCSLAESCEILETVPVQNLEIIKSSPSTALNTTTKAGDYGSQCDLLTDREKIESQKAEPQLFSMHETVIDDKSERVLSNTSTGCTLPHYSKTMTREWRFFNRTLNELLDSFIIGLVKRFTDDHKLTFSEKVIAMVTAYGSDLIMEAMKRIHTGDSEPSELKLKHWIKSVGFLLTLTNLLHDLMATAVETWRYHFSMPIRVDTCHSTKSIRPATPQSYEIVAPYMDYSDKHPSFTRGSPRRISTSSINASTQSSQSKLDVKAPRQFVPHPPEAPRPENRPARPCPWRCTARKAVVQKDLARTRLTDKRMEFLKYELLPSLSTEEHKLVKDIYHAVKPENNSHISAADLTSLLTTHTGRRFTIPCARKILHQVDVNGDKKLGLLDLLSVFYVTDIYLKSMAGDFRDQTLTQYSEACSSSHVILYIALSELCQSLKLKIPSGRNVFLQNTSSKPSTDGAYMRRSDLLNISHSPRLYSLCLIGHSNKWLEKMSTKLLQPTKIELTAGGDSIWCHSEYIAPSYDKSSRSLILPIISNNGILRYPLRPTMIRRNSVLNNPVAPSISVRGEILGYNPHKIYSNAGIKSYLRQPSTVHSIDKREDTSSADINSLREIKRLSDEGMVLAQMFLQINLYENHKLRELVHMFSNNPLRMWAKEVLPPITRPQTPEEQDMGTAGSSAKFTDTPQELYDVLEVLQEKSYQERCLSRGVAALS